MGRKRKKHRAAPPRLLAATGGRIDLVAGRSYVLGRGRDCDVVLEDLLSSRRHASIEVGETITIRDLESRNGTFVDDARIESETALPHGSRIRVGASVFLVCTSNASDDTIDTGTVALDQMALGRGIDEGILRSVRSEPGQGALAGQLDSIGLVDILQGVMQAGRSGTLHVALPTGHAQVEVRQGEVLDAICGEESGMDALVRLAREKVGVFWLAETDAECARTIDESRGRLLYALCRALD
jgi:pSer/pThr/pTyr-binding forkhead associated (FHA) protein